LRRIIGNGVGKVPVCNQTRRQMSGQQLLEEVRIKRSGSGTPSLQSHLVGPQATMQPWCRCTVSFSTTSLLLLDSEMALLLTQTADTSNMYLLHCFSNSVPRGQARALLTMFGGFCYKFGRLNWEWSWICPMKKLRTGMCLTLPDPQPQESRRTAALRTSGIATRLRRSARAKARKRVHAAVFFDPNVWNSA
jgi:hypothetical protein